MAGDREDLASVLEQPFPWRDELEQWIEPLSPFGLLD